MSEHLEPVIPAWASLLIVGVFALALLGGIGAACAVLYRLLS